MLFNSLTFAIFFAVVLLVHYSPISWWKKKLFLLIASYLFYAAWNPPLVILLWISTFGDWFLSKAIYRIEHPGRRRALLIVSFALNLGFLGFFKYGAFLAENFVRLLAAVGLHIQLAKPDIILPVGISFYTFQSLSYTFDVYRRKIAPWHSLLDYMLYVAFFPQLVSGPIMRASNFLPQLDEPKQASAKQLSWGLSLMLLGLFEKMVLADGLLAPIVEKTYDTAGKLTALDSWCGTLAFSGQIFFDFAGYSVCALGAALCLGMTLMTNFHFPYAAIGFSDFWRRWHISLSTWLRDYLYIPLGGNRRGVRRTYLNLMVTMLLGGLWHGAAWTFVIWGGLHGAYLAVERLAKSLIPAGKFWSRLPVAFCMGLGTYLLVSVTWVFFRAKQISRAFAMLGSMCFRASGASGSQLRANEVATVLAVSAALLGVHWAMRDKTLEQVADRMPRWARIAVLTGMLIAIGTVQGEDRAFIYFQF
jgi:alginate O-acetyltransferase complex protein AlgI